MDRRTQHPSRSGRTRCRVGNVPAQLAPRRPASDALARLLGESVGSSLSDMGYEGPNRRGAEGWHLRKELNVGHMLTTLALLGGLAVTWSQLNVRIALIEKSIEQQSTVDKRQDETSREAFARVDARLSSMDSKLDKLVEWQMHKYSMEREAR